MSRKEETTVELLKKRLEKAVKSNKEELNDIASPTMESCKDCLECLDEVPMTLQILTSTLIGATVAKFKSNETLGPLAKSLIKKWKKIAKEEESNGTSEKNNNSGTKNTASTSSCVSSMWSELAPNRQTICEKLYPLFCMVKSDIIEAGMNVDAVDECLARTTVEVELAINSFADSELAKTNNTGARNKAYVDKVRSIAFNLKKNTQLSQNLVFGAVTGDELVHMSAEQMASADQRKARAAQAQKLIDSKRLDWDQANEDKINEMCGIKGELLKASLFTCGRCKSVKTTSTQKQTRSADEPMTVFVLCLNCGNRWKC